MSLQHPPQMLSLVETHNDAYPSTDQHLTPPVTHPLAVCVLRSSEKRTFKIAIIILKTTLTHNYIIVGVN